MKATLIELCFLIFVFIKTTFAFGINTFNRSHVQQNIFLGGTTYKINLNEENPIGYLISPGFPYEYYPPNADIHYQIELDRRNEVLRLSSRLMLTFEVFHVQPTASCEKDGLEIVGSVGQDNVYCGSHMGRTLLSEGRKMKIRFFSDASIQSRGYKIRVEMFNSGCSGNFIGYYNGFFTSPRYPKSYIAEDICVWKIEGPPGTRVRVQFNGPIDLRTITPSCTQDYLAVSLTGNFKTDIKRICHSGLTPPPMTSYGNSMILMLRTDCCNEGHGFSASFRIFHQGRMKYIPPPIPKSPNCDCGIENVGISERILGGEFVTVPNKYPWMVGLTGRAAGKDVFFCGGALINRFHILTAAHCVANKRHSQIRVALGAHDTKISPSPVPVEKIIVHPQFGHDDFTNDIGLLRLLYPVNLDWAVNVVCLPPPQDFAWQGIVGVVAGWGRTVPEEDDEKTNWEDNQYKSDILKSLNVIVVNNTFCYSVYGDVIRDTNLCAGGNKGEDSCTGDSGGPLIYKFKNRYYIVGVVSWGVSCGEQGYPGVYTRVSKYLDWIYQEAKDPLHCNDYII